MRLRDRFPNVVGSLVMSDDEFWSLHPLRLRVLMGVLGFGYLLIGLLLWCLAAVGLGALDFLFPAYPPQGRWLTWPDLVATTVAALTMTVVGLGALVLAFRRSAGVKRVVSLLCRYMPLLCVLTAVGVLALRERYWTVFVSCLLVFALLPGLVLNRYVRWVEVK